MLVDVVFSRPHDGSSGLGGLVGNAARPGCIKSIVIWYNVEVDLADAVPGKPLKCGPELAKKVGGGFTYVNWWTVKGRNPFGVSKYSQIEAIKDGFVTNDLTGV